MHDLKWSASEKVLARRVLDAALAAELAEVLAELKAKAAAAAVAEDVWAIEGFLRERRRAIDEKYDHRYSVLLFVFGRLLREGRVQEADVVGLSEQNLAHIRQIASM